MPVSIMGPRISDDPSGFDRIPSTAVSRSTRASRFYLTANGPNA